MQYINVYDCCSTNVVLCVYISSVIFTLRPQVPVGSTFSKLNLSRPSWIDLDKESELI